LLGLKDGEWYTGAAADLKGRVREHEQGELTRFSPSIAAFYYEACLQAADAYRRERYLKTGRG
jgi:predicted GIY-YIG superfamily endonuclease